jgi:hypothetical protein
MTVNATLSQDGDSVTLPLLADGGDILLAVDSGKPQLITHDTGGTAFPRTQDQWSGQKQYNLIGYFSGANAHQDAIDLVELIHKDGNGNPMVLDIPGISELDSNIFVAPSAEQDRALNLKYPNGIKNYVEFDLGLTRVDSTLGSYDRTISTPTASGTGPIQLSNGTTTVDLEVDVSIDRYVGRPNDVVRKSQRLYPRYEIKRKIVNDEFEISVFFTNSEVTKTEDIADLFTQKLERNALTLNFNGLFGLGEFNVMPSGSGALRHVRESGKEGISIIPTINLQRVHQ